MKRTQNEKILQIKMETSANAAGGGSQCRSNQLGKVQHQYLRFLDARLFEGCPDTAAVRAPDGESGVAVKDGEERDDPV